MSAGFVQSMPDPYEEAKRRKTALLSRLEDLDNGWNGHDAAPTTPEALAVVSALHIVPRANGGVQFEWHVNGQDVEISVGPTGQLDGFFVETAEHSGEKGSHTNVNG